MLPTHRDLLLRQCAQKSSSHLLIIDHLKKRHRLWLRNLIFHALNLPVFRGIMSFFVTKPENPSTPSPLPFWRFIMTGPTKTFVYHALNRANTQFSQWSWFTKGSCSLISVNASQCCTNHVMKKKSTQVRWAANTTACSHGLFCFEVFPEFFMFQVLYKPNFSFL